VSKDGVSTLFKAFTLTRRKWAKLITAACIPAVAQLQSQTDSTGWSNAEDRHRLFLDSLARRAAAITRNPPGIESAAGWPAKRADLRGKLRYMLGLEPLPPRTPLNARITGRLDRNGYSVENIVFESLPRAYVTGNLYVPEGVQGRLPAVVYLSGHNPTPAGNKTQFQHHGIWFARHGYVALLLDTIEFGEAPGIHHGTANLGTRGTVDRRNSWHRCPEIGGKCILPEKGRAKHTN